MIAEARKTLHAYQNVRYLLSDFESAKLDNGTFDLVVSGTAFHWLPEKVYKKVGLKIKKNGHLAIFAGFSDSARSQFLRRKREIRNRLYPNYPGDVIKFMSIPKGLKKTGLFDKLKLFNYDVIERKAPSEYFHMMESYSWIVSLSAKKRDAVFSELKSSLRNQKTISIPMAYKLILARRK